MQACHFSANTRNSTCLLCQFPEFKRQIPIYFAEPMTMFSAKSNFWRICFLAKWNFRFFPPLFLLAWPCFKPQKRMLFFLQQLLRRSEGTPDAGSVPQPARRSPQPRVAARRETDLAGHVRQPHTDALHEQLPEAGEAAGTGPQRAGSQVPGLQDIAQFKVTFNHRAHNLSIRDAIVAVIVW